MLLFMSYADEDDKIAQEIADKLSSNDVSVYSTKGAVARRISRLPSAPSEAIQKADAFLALISSHSMASPQCRRERDAALLREQCLHQSGSAQRFVQVLQVGQTPYHEVSSLRDRPWHDLTTLFADEGLLAAVVESFGSPDANNSNIRQIEINNRRSMAHNPGFRNRKKELDEVVNGITSGGERYWLVVAPPQMGKSWFLNEIASNIGDKLPTRCTIELVDVHDLSPDAIKDPDAILRLMFGFEPRGEDQPINTGQILKKLNDKSCLHLCLLDGAELLSSEIIRHIRSLLGDIDNRLTNRKNPSARLALIAASRRDDDWAGVVPGPRLKVLTLTGFKEDIVAEELSKAAKDADYALSTSQMRQIAHRLHRLSEGLPALLVNCIAWAQERSFDIEGLEDAENFQTICGPYIEQSLLSPDSLRISGKLPDSNEQAAIRRVIQMMSPYRVITYSLVDRCAEDSTLREALTTVRWSVRDLWEAVSNIDLLYRPERNPWKTIYEPVRRLLCKYWRSAAEDRQAAHSAAAEFMASFLAEQSGSDQWRIALECMWHEAQAQGVATMGGGSNPTMQMEELFLARVKQLIATLKYESPDVVLERRIFATDILRKDTEFEGDLGSAAGLYGRLVEIVGSQIPGVQA